MLRLPCIRRAAAAAKPAAAAELQRQCRCCRCIKRLLLWLLRHHHGKSCQGLNVVKREKGSVPGLLLREV